MNRNIIRNPWLVKSLIFSLLLLVSVSCNKEKPGSHPNLLIVFPDQMRGQAIGFLEAEPVITPNLDRLAANGLFFTNDPWVKHMIED
jgi:hypothetical protein